MVKLIPVLKHALWGGDRLEKLFSRGAEGGTLAESWEVSVHPNGPSGCEGGGTLPEFLARHPDAAFPEGGEFPLLIKYIDAADKSSLQVHPDDEYARVHAGDNGKTEAWYVVCAEPDSGVWCGFREKTDPDEFRRRIRDGSAERLLEFIPVRAGDCILVEAGTVHAIGAGCLILEVQESSDVTYRVYDHGRLGADGKPRQLHVEDAMKVICFDKHRDATGGGETERVPGGSIRLLTRCRYFRMRELLLSGEYRERAEKSFLVVNCVEGEGEISGERFRGGDSFFVPAGEEIALRGAGRVVLTDAGRE